MNFPYEPGDCILQLRKDRALQMIWNPDLGYVKMARLAIGVVPRSMAETELSIFARLRNNPKIICYIHKDRIYKYIRG